MRHPVVASCPLLLLPQVPNCCSLDTFSPQYHNGFKANLLWRLTVVMADWRHLGQGCAASGQAGRPPCAAAVPSCAILSRVPGALPIVPKLDTEILRSGSRVLPVPVGAEPGAGPSAAQRQWQLDAGPAASAARAHAPRGIAAAHHHRVGDTNCG